MLLPYMRATIGTVTFCYADNHNCFITAEVPMTIRARIQQPACLVALAILGILPALALAATASSDPPPDSWQFSASLYLWLPSVSSTVDFPVPGTGTDIDVDASQLLSHLEMAGMGAFDVHHGRWGAFTDVIYMNLSGSKADTRDFSFGNIGIPATTSADLHFGLKAWVWTLAGEYRVAQDAAWTVDLLAGTRYLDVSTNLNWSITGGLGPLPPASRTGASATGAHIWDGIVGVKGQYAFGADGKWFVPFYLDIGTGDSQLTDQGLLGIGYSYQWGQITASWRYLEYRTQSSRIGDLSFSGPMVGATFRW